MTSLFTGCAGVSTRVLGDVRADGWMDLNGVPENPRPNLESAAFRLLCISSIANTMINIYKSRFTKNE